MRDPVFAGLPDPHDVLGVKRGATQEEIRAAWRRRVQQLHPDVCKDPDARERFVAARTAYLELSTSARERSDASRITGDELWARFSNGKPPTPRQRVGLIILESLFRLL